MKKEAGFWESEMPVYKRALLFPVWLFSNIYVVILLLCAALVPLGIAFELWDWIK